MIRGSCHCGTVTFEIAAKPDFMVSCNCSICRRLATYWVYTPDNKLTLNAPEGSTLAYSWGDVSIALHTCKTCGCTTHWASIDTDRIAVNCRLAEPDSIKDVRVRRFDGADTWEFLD